MRTTGLARGFSTLVVASFALIVLGALVRANGAGLACPDWPLCFGAVVPVFDMHIAFEWSHRALAGSVSLGLAALTWLSLRRVELRALVTWPLAVAWTLLIAQVVLGGLTVLLLLAPWTVTAHLIVGTSFCATLLWIARDLYEAPRTSEPGSLSLRRALPAIVAAAAGLLVAQVVLGGMVASHAAGLACSRIPTCNGESFAPTLVGPVGLHVLHRLCGVALVVCLGLVALAGRHAQPLSRLAWGAFHLVILQVGIGALNVLLRLPVEVTALHSAVACAISLTTVLIVRETWLSRAEFARAPQRAQALEAG
jgi:cytochrome c oxidase assembly protein subunit 15